MQKYVGKLYICFGLIELIEWVVLQTNNTRIKAEMFISQ